MVKPSNKDILALDYLFLITEKTLVYTVPTIFSIIGWCSRKLRLDELLALWDYSPSLISSLNFNERRKLCSWNSISSKTLFNLLIFLLFDNHLLYNDYLNVNLLPRDTGWEH